MEAVRRNAERLSTLIEDILDVTRIESNKLKIEKTEFDLNEKINNVIKDLAVKDNRIQNITITLEKTERNAKKFIIVRIKDDCKRIDPQILPRLFTKFVTKSESGTRLGLYISKNIIEAHEGSIRGYNNPDGKGTTFEFTLPLNENKNL